MEVHDIQNSQNSLEEEQNWRTQFVMPKFTIVINVCDIDRRTKKLQVLMTLLVSRKITTKTRKVAP